MPFMHTQTREQFVVNCDALTIGFSRDDGGLRSLRRSGGPELAGHGEPRPSLDIALRDRGWLGERTVVRYLNHRVEERDGGVEIVVAVGLGPLIVYDCYVVGGALVTRHLSIKNVGEDDVALLGVRMQLPWLLTGMSETRFEAPGNSVRSRVLAHVAADQRAGVLPRRFFAPGLRFGSAFEPAPTLAPGLLALHNPGSEETLLCWYQSGAEPALPEVFGNGTALTLGHQAELAACLRPDAVVDTGTQLLTLLHASWPEALAIYHRIAMPAHPSAAPPRWLAGAALYECHPAQWGGFAGLSAELPRIATLGVDTLCLLPILERGAPAGDLWDGSDDAHGPFTIADFEQLDATLGTADELRDLVRAAHEHGLRVLVELPLHGCAAGAPLVAAHPEWFCRDELGHPVESVGDAPVVVFDWGSEALREYLASRALALVREYALDGLRLAPPRSTPPNWAKGLPHHASAGALGYLALVERLRRELQALEPAAALLGGFGGPALARHQDASVDELPHHMFFHLGLGRLAPAELSAWLADHCAVQPPQTLRVCYTESYFTHRLNPLANGMRGSRISRMLLAGMVLCGFVPLLRAGQEDADREFITRLLAARAASSALLHGETYYDAVAVDAPQVFSVLRRAPGEIVIGLLNTAPQRITVTLRLSPDTLGLPAGEYQLFDLLQSTERTTVRADVTGIQLTLEPYQAAGMALQPSDAVLGQYAGGSGAELGAPLTASPECAPTR
jgi:starch synthase (maltosyl-transferring)